MRSTCLVSIVLIAIGLSAPVMAAPRVESLGSAADVRTDSVAACEGLAAAPWESGRPGTGLSDEQIYLDDALTACVAALNAEPDNARVKTWTARVALLLGQAEMALPMLEDAAAAGNPLAMFILADLYSHARDSVVPFDPDRGYELMLRAADAGYVPAMLALAEDAELATTPDYETAFSFYSKAADSGDPHAIYKLGWMYHYGIAVTQDVVRARQYYQSAADAGGAEGWYGLGQILQNGDLAAADIDAARAAYEKGADAAEPMSQTALAYLYEQAIGVEQDYTRSFALLTEAVKKDYGFAKAALSIHYLLGEGTEVDATKAYELANEAANAGVAYAHGIKGYINEYGLGTRRDLDQALTDYRAGADLGDDYAKGRIEIVEAAIACADLAGSPYEFNGVHGVEFDAIDAEAAISACQHALDLNPDVVGNKTWLARALLRAERTAEAVPLLDEARNAADPLAQTLYASLLMTGNGVPQDQQAAVVLYTAAADAGFGPAMVELGKALIAGDGTSVDRVAAHKWLTSASEQGLESARDMLASFGTSEVTATVDLTGFAREELAY